MVPIDVIKTRMQITPTLYPNFSTSARAIVQAEGIGALLLGLGPTFYGYAAQGALKYGLYEYFKRVYSEWVDENTAKRYASGIYLLAGMTAETVADFSLAPLEAIRIRWVSQPTYTTSTFKGLGRLAQEDGIYQGWYRGLLPLILKQVPYTAVKFCVFEGTLKGMDMILPTKRADLPRSHQLVLSFIAGFVGGVASAVASHPADTLLTAVNAANKNSQTSVSKAIAAKAKELGWKGIWRGLVPRMGMVGIMAASQLWVYDTSKVMIFGLPVTQGIPVRQ
jgi:solute carrier family 25 phosphate transporter 3